MSARRKYIEVAIEALEDLREDTEDRRAVDEIDGMIRRIRALYPQQSTAEASQR